MLHISIINTKIIDKKSLPISQQAFKDPRVKPGDDNLRQKVVSTDPVKFSV